MSIAIILDILYAIDNFIGHFTIMCLNPKVLTLSYNSKSNEITKDFYNKYDNLLLTNDISTSNKINYLLNHPNTFIINCNKCEECISTIRFRYSNKVKVQLSKFPYSYFLTFTFNNLNIDKLNPNLFTLNKYSFIKVLENLRNKLKRYYKKQNQDINIHYFFCGEYGSNTFRPHYHCVLFLTQPIPNLKSLPIKGLRYTTPIFDYCKQFGFYDLQQINNSNNCSNKVSNYITKYITKFYSNDLSNTFFNYNRQQSKLLHYLSKHNIFLEHIPKDDIDMFNSYLSFLNLPFFNNLYSYILSNNINYLYNYMHINMLKLYPQKPFLRISRCLGISNNFIDDMNNGVLNSYYKLKYLKQHYISNLWNLSFPNNEFSLFYFNQYILSNFKDTLINSYKLYKKNNIIKYMDKKPKIIKPSIHAFKDVF